MDISIGELATRAATKVQTIRYYEQIGLSRCYPQQRQQRPYDKVASGASSLSAMAAKWVSRWKRHASRHE
jgi:hypothetical protein